MKRSFHLAQRSKSTASSRLGRGRAFVLVLTTLVSSAYAQDLRQIYEAAKANDATIRASRASVQGERERISQAQAQRLPNISLNAARNYNDLTSHTRDVLGRPTTAQNTYYSSNQSLTVRQPIYRPFLSATLRQAQAQVADAEANLEKDEQSLAMKVGEAYFDALLAEDQLDLIRAQKTTYNAQLDASRKRLAAGYGVRTDIDEAQAQLDMTLARELEARQNVDYTRRRLEVMTGGAISVLAKLDTLKFSPTPPTPDSLDAWTQRAEESSPELQSLRAQLDAAGAEIEKAKSGHKPTLDAVAQWSRSNSDSVTSVNSRYDNKVVGLQLTVPLYGGGYVSSTVRQAVAIQERAREMLEAVRRDLGVRVHREFRAVTEGVLKIRALEQAVVSAEQAVLSNQKSFAAGSRTMLDVLNAEQQKTLSQRDLAQARYLYLVARMRLQALAGEDREATVNEASYWLAQQATDKPQ